MVRRQNSKQWQQDVVDVLPDRGPGKKTWQFLSSFWGLEVVLTYG